MLVFGSWCAVEVELSLERWTEAAQLANLSLEVGSDARYLGPFLGGAVPFQIRSLGELEAYPTFCLWDVASSRCGVAHSSRIV